MAQAFPRVTANILGAQTTALPGERKILVVGQLLAAGSATSGDLQENVLSELEFNNLFGRKSQIAKMGRGLTKALSISRLKPQIDAIALSDNGTTDAEGTVTFAGTSTAAGTLTFYVDSIKNGKVEVATITKLERRRNCA